MLCPMVGNPKWPFSEGDENDTNFRPILVFIILALLIMVLTFWFVLTNRFGVFSSGDW
ncbi:hypothetical protein MAMT_00129 [Methylacidimicrobium tartarophylax]|uniref:Uncharacterized protein n=2 Tax=Methylacidimicrobium tartarophylax TaxID=1041768 RepID=A0A5E6M6E2_9BACT|nr:hypothetical protein MAMT_00129 [Methylacidimicrobium tartarophylax]